MVAVEAAHAAGGVWCGQCTFWRAAGASAVAGRVGAPRDEQSVQSINEDFVRSLIPRCDPVDIDFAHR